MTNSPAEEPSPEDIALAQSVLESWNGGNQPQAVELLRPRADDGAPWAVSLICWLMMQQGLPAIQQAVPYARQAIQLGMPWITVNLFNNLIGQAPNSPEVAQQAIDLLMDTAPWPALGVDPVGQGWNLLSQAQPAQAIKLMGIAGSFPLTREQWDQYLTAARDQTSELTSMVDSAREERVRVAEFAQESTAAIDKSRGDLETSAQQAGLLVSSVVSDATNALYKEDAKRNEQESNTAWKWGLLVLGAAAVVAILPLLLHYLDLGEDYSTTATVGAHVAATAALATVAGVVLARARSRDQARQRANDLSTAMGTMISYSNQIQDPVEKQRFMMTMGQLVLQAHLTVGAPPAGREDSLTGIAALANAMRTDPEPGPS